MIRFALLMLLTIGCAPTPTYPVVLNTLPPRTSQAIVVTPIPATVTQVELIAYERDATGWIRHAAPTPGVVGRNGIVSPETKHEGDGCTPSGVYRLQRAFGYSPEMKTGLDYQPVTDNDFWIDEANDPQYNRWVQGEKPTMSHELLRRGDDLYEMFAVIEYNTEPIRAGKGSAIFFHVWNGPNSSTAGCVAIDKTQLRGYLEWLDATKEPMMVIGE